MIEKKLYIWEVKLRLNYMKNLFTIILFSLTAFMANAQILLQVGDTVELSVTGVVAGTIQWQQSDDSLTWTDIPGAVNNPQIILATASATEKRYYFAKVTDPLCPLATPVFSSPIQHRVKTLVQIGDYYEGGIVFYTDGTGHGLIAPQTDQSTGVQWGCQSTSIPGATSLTDGNTNTTVIYNNCATRPIAASICYDLVLNGDSDWFLPAKNQLNYLYQQRALVGGFAANYYWSSSEANADYAWEQYFGNGNQLYSYKDYSVCVRCVRSF